MKPLKWRIIFVLGLTLLALYSVAPTIIYFSQPKDIRNNQEEFLKKVPSWLPQSHVKLGLDLQGGVQLVLGVNTPGAIMTRLSRLAVEISRWSEGVNLKVETAYLSKEDNKLTVVLAGDVDSENFKSELKKEFPTLELTSLEEKTLKFDLKESEKEHLEKSALEQAERVVRDRIDMWGVSEPIIFRRADGSIMVQLPGFSDPEQAKQLLGRTAQLKFKIVDDQFTGFDKITGDLPAGITRTSNGGQTAFSSESRDDLFEFLKGYVPEDRELLFSRESIADNKKNLWTSYVVHAATEMMGDDIVDSFLGQGGTLDQKPVVILKFSPMGGRRFAEVTGANVNKRMAIVLDNVVESAPVIQQKIVGGTATITLGGGRSYNEIIEEGNELSLVLKSGAIPAEIKVLEERQVGASLGPELANQGIKGILFGLGLILIFMLVYYRRPGAIACLALILNAVFLLAVMAGFGFALTLPGIAGFVLTLGMAVDANVLINERIRQEVREGRHPRKAVEAGFGKVFGTIMDSNITTLVAALVLLETNSSGPIRGFAITLIFGLLVSLFTSLYCSRLFFDIFSAKVSDKNIKAWLTSGGFKPRTDKINFLKVGTPSTIIAVLLSVGVLGTALVKGVNFGVDFAGGTEVVVEFAKDIDAGQIRTVAEKAQIDDLTVQALEGGKKHYLLRYEEAKADEADGAKASASDVFVAFKNSILTELKDYNPDIQQVDFVGPQVGKELRNQGLISVLYAILAVMLYIAFRFDMRFAPGALIKMFLDVFIMLGFYVFFGASFDLVAVAAFLTVVGYSVNDTIVIYDRIRENLLANPRRTLVENINMAINETLGRSINTSLTTIISLVGILIFSSGQIWNFAMALTIGVLVATVSSILIASSFVIWFEKWKRERVSLKSVSDSAR